MIKEYPFYYAENYDFTTSYKDQQPNPNYKTADRRFFWNEHLVQQLIEKGLDDWVCPITMGFVCSFDQELNGRKVLPSLTLFETYSLVSYDRCFQT